MPRTTLILACVASLAACETTGLNDSRYVLAETPATEAVEGRATWGAPLPLAGTAKVVVPFARERQLRLFSDPDAWSEGGAASRGYLYEAPRFPADRAGHWTHTAPVRWHNAMLVDLESGDQWPLLEQRGVLSRYWMSIAGDGSGDRVARGLLFAATVEDSNGDGKLDDRDASRALIADVEGAARFVSPPGTQLRDVRYDAEHGLALLMIASDANGDGEFSDEEPPEPYVVGGDLELRRLVDPEAAARVEALLDAD